jgi:hypothetical protein
MAAPSSGENASLARLQVIDRHDHLQPAGTGALRPEELGSGTL